MPPSLTPLIQSLKLPALSKTQVHTLQSLQDNWERHSERMEHLRPERAMLDQKAAYGAFTADPSPENEQRLAVLADERLTTKRYALLRQVGMVPAFAPSTVVMLTPKGVVPELPVVSLWREAFVRVAVSEAAHLSDQL